MSDQLLHDDIVSILRNQAQGKANAMPRAVLLGQLHALGHTVTDRTMRRVYAEVPQIGYTCEGERRGLFWITSRDEAHGVERCQHSKAMATLHREKATREAAPCGQLGLWEETR